MAPKWEMIWNDDFDGDEVDLTKWNILDCPNSINNDIAYMAPHNVWVADGCLVLRQQNENFKGFQYTSSKVNSFGKFSFMFGRVVPLAKAPAESGFYTTLWTMLDGCTGTATGNIDCQWLPEIDFIEIGHHFHLDNCIAVFVLLIDDPFFDPVVNRCDKSLPPVLRAKNYQVFAAVYNGSVDDR